MSRSAVPFRMLCPAIALAAAILTPGSPALAVDDGSADAYASIQLFGCIMPLPPGYVLNADGQPFVFHQCCDLNKIGNTIRIKPYKEPDLLNFEVLRDFKIGHLTIVTVASTYTRNPVTLTYMHDGKTKLTIVGDDEVWIDRMAKACMDNPVWQPPPDFHFEQLDPH